jgi:hypothetical protein
VTSQPLLCPSLLDVRHSTCNEVWACYCHDDAAARQPAWCYVQVAGGHGSPTASDAVSLCPRPRPAPRHAFRQLLAIARRRKEPPRDHFLGYPSQCTAPAYCTHATPAFRPLSPAPFHSALKRPFIGPCSSLPCAPTRFTPPYSGLCTSFDHSHPNRCTDRLEHSCWIIADGNTPTYDSRPPQA